MEVLGIDIGKTRFDACLMGQNLKQSISLANNEVGFAQLAAWLVKQRPNIAAPLHACMEATGNYGLDLAAFLFAEGVTVSIVNPRKIKAFGEAELARNKTDQLDCALIARFCIAQNPQPWTPPAQHIRNLRELVRRCAALKAQRTQELNRQKSGFACEAVRASLLRQLTHLNAEIDIMTAEIRALLAADSQLQRNFDLLNTIPGIGEVSATLLLAEIPNITDFTPKALAAFAGLSPAEHSSGARQRGTGISRIGNAAIRSMLYLGALSASRHNPHLTDFVARMKDAKKPKKVILVAVARKLLVLAQAVLRTQTGFHAHAA
jgi:transposase